MTADSSKDGSNASVLEGLTKVDIHGHTVARLPKAGAAIASSEQSSDLIGNVWFDHIETLVIPAERLTDDFFDLKTGYAGEVLRKAISYGVRLVIIGDIQPYIERSKAFADFVREINKGEHVWFLPQEEALEAKLAAQN